MTRLSDAVVTHLRQVAELPDLSGTRYEAVRPIGQGGMGTVYLAVDRELEREVALKVLHADAGDEQAAARLRLFLRICETVEFAHARGVLHRDLKPANIMVGPFGEVLVLDWGVARITGETDVPGALRAGGSEWETADGTVIGTSGFMAPEQVHGEVRAAALADDIARFLDAQPVLAYRESPVERVRRVVVKYQTAILLVLAYLAMRILILITRGL